MLFDWRDEVQKKSKKQDIELAALLFLVGLLLLHQTIAQPTQGGQQHNDDAYKYFFIHILLNLAANLVFFYEKNEELLRVFNLFTIFATLLTLKTPIT